MSIPIKNGFGSVSGVIDDTVGNLVIRLSGSGIKKITSLAASYQIQGDAGDFQTQIMQGRLLVIAGALMSPQDYIAPNSTASIETLTPLYDIFIEGGKAVTINFSDKPLESVMDKDLFIILTPATANAGSGVVSTVARLSVVGFTSYEQNLGLTLG